MKRFANARVVGATRTPQASSARATVAPGAARDPATALGGVLGNHTLQRLFAAGAIRPKLRISEPNDPDEQEADRVADRVMRMPATPREEEAPCSACAGGAGPCPACAAKRGRFVRRRARGDGEARHRPVPDGFDSALGPGRPLDPGLRAFFEPRFGRDFGDVRIHTGTTAAERARGIDAHAFALGRDVVFGAGQYAPHTTAGRRLLAHELAHVLQQAPRRTHGNAEGSSARSAAGPVSRIDPQSAPIHIARDGPSRPVPRSVSSVELSCSSNSIVFHTDAGSVSYRLSECDLTDGDYTAGVRVSGGDISFDLGTAAATGRRFRFRYDIAPGQPNPAEFFRSQTTVRIIARSGLSLVGEEGPGGLITIPTDITFSLVGPAAPVGGGGDFGLFPSLVRSPAIGGARGLGYAISPPVRGWLDPFLSLRSRLGTGLGPLGELPGGRIGLERYLPTYDVRRGLTPRYALEGAELRLGEYTRAPTPWSRVGITSRELERIPGLVARLSEGGSLSAAEQTLLQTFIRAHAEEGIVFASPALSATARPGLSTVAGVNPFLREAPYVVRIEVPASAAVDVNAALGSGRSARLVQELEVLVTTDARGVVTNIRPNPTSSLARAAPYLRWGGRALIVVGVGVTAYRLATATEAELPRVIGEEAGGWAGGFAGAALVAGGCVAFGIATGGIGLVLCGIAGGVAGGIGGSYLGGEIGEAAGHSRPSSTPFTSMPFVCFTADTRVRLADGSSKPIGEIAVGEQVLACDEGGTSVGVGTVTKVFEKMPQAYLRIGIDDGSVLKVTPHHHLFAATAEARGWTEAGRLRVGDDIYGIDAVKTGLVPRRIVSVAVQSADGPVFDLSVEPQHTYFAEGVLAHNKLP